MNALEHLKMSNEYYEKKRKTSKNGLWKVSKSFWKKKRQYARKL